MGSVMTHSHNGLPSAYDPGLAEKEARSLSLIHSAFEQLGDRLVVEHNLTRESGVVWDLARRAIPKVRGFCIATRFQPPETALFIEQLAAQYPEIRIYESFTKIPDDLRNVDPSLCCKILRVQPRRQALEEMNVCCLVTGFHHGWGASRLHLREFQEITATLSELNPILTWDDRDVARYAESHQIPCSPLPAKAGQGAACRACLRGERDNKELGDELALIVQAQAERNVRRGRQHLPGKGEAR